MKILVLLPQSPLRAISISTLAAVTLMTTPFALSAHPSAGHRMDPLQTTSKSSRRNAPSVTVQEGKDWGQDVAEIWKTVGGSGRSGTRKGRFAKPASELCCARRDMVSIYLYDSNKNAINVTGIDSYQEPIVIDAAGNTIGMVEANDNIVNSSGTVIGFITESAD
jgi:hypothetical protein